MENQYAIEVKNVSKYFKVYADKGNTAKEKVLFWKRNKYEKKTVLNDVSFQVKKGESIGLVGHNGCGKSTTLKILTRIMYPDAGSVIINGRVSSLLELGAGFHPDMTGIENIYINASIFGLSKKEIDTKLDDIIEFAELGDYINNPVRTYSSGMYMRLAFSVAINVNADILLIDEILAVGDVNFQTKCFNKLFELKNQGVTIVLVSHSMDQVEKICERSIWLQDGEIRLDATPHEVQREYLKFMSNERKRTADEKIEAQQKKEQEEEQKRAEEQKSDKETKNEKEMQQETPEAKVDEAEERRGTGEARITKVKCYDETGKESYFITGEGTLKFKIQYHVKKKVEKAVFGLCIIRNDGVRCYGINSKSDQIPMKRLEEDGEVYMIFENLKLLSGTYTADVTIEAETGDTIDYYDRVVTFEVGSERKSSGVAWLEHEWIM